MAKAPNCCCSTWHKAPDGESPPQNAGGVFWARQPDEHTRAQQVHRDVAKARRVHPAAQSDPVRLGALVHGDRKSTRLNSSHTVISYAVFCLKKKTNKNPQPSEL